MICFRLTLPNFVNRFSLILICAGVLTSCNSNPPDNQVLFTNVTEDSSQLFYRHSEKATKTIDGVNCTRYVLNTENDSLTGYFGLFGDTVCFLTELFEPPCFPRYPVLNVSSGASFISGGVLGTACNTSPVIPVDYRVKLLSEHKKGTDRVFEMAYTVYELDVSSVDTCYMTISLERGILSYEYIRDKESYRLPWAY